MTPCEGSPQRPAPPRTSPIRTATAAALVGISGIGLLAVYIARFPPVGLAAVEPTTLSSPDIGKLFAILRSIFWLALINVCTLSLGSLFEMRLPLSPSLARFRVLYRLGIGFSLLGLGILLLASFHWLHALGFAMVLLVPPLLGGLLSKDRLQAWLGDFRLGHPSRVTRWSWAAYALLLANAFLHVFGNDVGWDALTYHLAFPERYLFLNGIVMTPFSHLSGYIAGTQMLYTLALFLDGPSLATLIHFEFGVLTLVALWQLAGTHSRRAAILAPLFLLSDPLFQMELGWAYSDLSLGFYVTLSAIAYCTYLEARSAGKADRRDLLYAGVTLGLCVATRYLGASVAIALCLLTWLPPHHARGRENLRTCLALAGLAALVMAPWMLRNAILTGNPVTPLLQSLFYAPGEEYIPAIVMQQSTEFLRQVGMGRDWGSLLALPWNLTMNGRPGSYENSFGFQVSPLYLIGLFCVVGVSVSGRHLRGIALRAPILKLVGLYVLVWFFAFQEARFLLPIFPLLAFAGAVSLDQLVTESPRFGRGLLVLPIIAVLYSQLTSLPSLANEYESALGYAMQDPGDDESGVKAAADFLRNDMAANDRLLLWMEQRAYLFHGVDYVPYHIGSGSPTLALVHRFDTPRALHCEFQAMGITHILINRRFAKIVQPGLLIAGYRQQDFLADRGRINRLVAASARRLFTRDEFEVYRIEDRVCGSN